MNVNKDLKKIALLMIVLSLGCGLIGATLGVFAYSQYYIPPVEPQWLSRFNRLKIDGNADVLTLEAEGHQTQTVSIFEIQQYTDTVVFSVDNDGDTLISGTLTISDAIAFAGDLDMGNNEILNIGAAGTDFQDDGGLITASTVTVTAGGLVVSAGTADLNAGIAVDDTAFTVADATGNTVVSGTLTVTDTSDFVGDVADSGGDFTIADALDVTGLAELDGGFTIDDTAFTVADGTGVTVISGTLTVTDTSDFIGNIADSGGDLTIADDVDITLGLDVQGGAIVLQNDEEIQNDVNGTVTLHIAGADEWDFTADQLDATNGQIVNIGAAGTDFSGSGGLTLADALTISSGGADITGDIDGSAEFQVGTFLNFTAATFITVTNGAVFTPTATYQPIKAAGEVTPTISTSGFTAGDELRLVNEAAQTINLADSGTAKLSAAWAAGQYDVLVLLFDGTNWLEIGRSDN